MQARVLVVALASTGCFSFVWHSELDKAPAVMVPIADADPVSWKDASSSHDNYAMRATSDGAVCIERAGQVTTSSSLRPKNLGLAMYVSNKDDRPTDDTPKFPASQNTVIDWECAKTGEAFVSNGSTTLYHCEFKYAFCFAGAAASLADAHYATFVWDGVSVLDAGKRDIVRISSR